MKSNIFVNNKEISKEEALIILTSGRFPMDLTTAIRWVFEKPKTGCANIIIRLSGNIVIK